MAGAPLRGPGDPLTARALSLLALLLAASAVPALAQEPTSSLGVTPPRVDLQDAQRGQAYEQRITLQNQFDSPTEITLGRGGNATNEVGNWTKATPASGFTIPPREERVVTLSIQVPLDAPNGLHTGFLQLIAEPKEQPEGSGFAIRYAVSVLLNVTVGGEQVVRLVWGAVRALDVEIGSPPQVLVNVTNAGNVRTTAAAAGEIVDALGAPVLVDGRGNAEVLPGQTLELPVEFQGTMPRVGAHRAHVTSIPGLDGWAEFDVKNLGELGKDGLLRFLQHQPWVEPSLPVKVTAIFENVGRAAIGSARLRGEVQLAGKLVGTLESDALAVPVGRAVNLTAYFTPTAPGTYRLLGKVVYDGLESQENESVLNVQVGGTPAGPADGVVGGAGGLAMPPWLLWVVLALVGVGILVGAGRKRRDQGKRKR